MKIKNVEHSEITSEDIELYKQQTSELKGVIFNGPQVGMDKRIVSIRLGEVDSELVLVNPVIIETSADVVVYFEKDYNNLKKVRKTRRYPSIFVQTDNYGKVEFTSTNKNWENGSQFMQDKGLLECVLAQRIIDSINGIDITHPTVSYKEEIRRPIKIGRNEKVMLQSPDGNDTVFIKYKKADEFINRGYKVV